MEYFWYVVVGLIGGLIGGMGMGGGTLLIPLLGVFCGVNQHTAQAINLIAFIPMAIVALIIHIKNKFVRFDKVLWIVIVGVITCIVGCHVAKVMSGNLLKRCFGGFLILLSIFQFFQQIKAKEKK